MCPFGTSPSTHYKDLKPVSQSSLAPSEVGLWPLLFRSERMASAFHPSPAISGRRRKWAKIPGLSPRWISPGGIFRADKTHLIVCVPPPLLCCGGAAAHQRNEMSAFIVCLSLSSWERGKSGGKEAHRIHKSQFPPARMTRRGNTTVACATHSS
jgi:hypothetical protein